MRLKNIAKNKELIFNIDIVNYSPLIIQDGIIVEDILFNNNYIYKKNIYSAIYYSIQNKIKYI